MVDHRVVSLYAFLVSALALYSPLSAFHLQLKGVESSDGVHMEAWTPIQDS